MSEAFTNGKVSALAKREYERDHARELSPAGAFVKIRNGYMMYAWQSQIAMCRAYGRGVASGKGYSVHPFDVRVTP